MEVVNLGKIARESRIYGGWRKAATLWKETCSCLEREAVRARKRVRAPGKIRVCYSKDGLEKINSAKRESPDESCLDSRSCVKRGCTAFPHCVLLMGKVLQLV